ncbi:MAG: hypothetical protein AUJ18_10965 [Candidatus Hydrogenedentes bacterium CG1_02_42_14]|nr:MAG: hypothetical protein AUJ18_10965 [Candidatus Hydrogenedentes bacterium CG1_02_42_14]
MPEQKNNMKKNLMLHLISWLVVIISIFILSFFYLHRSDLFLWDFRLYYSAGLALNSGVNPYDSTELSRFTTFAEYFPCAYHYLVLNFYRLLAVLSISHAMLVFQLCKLIALLLLILMWLKLFPKLKKEVFFPFAVLFGFNAALILDLRSGNISLFETLLITSGLLAFNAGKYRLFSLLIVCAAMIKLSPIIFLCMLIFADERRAWRWGALAAFSFFVLLASPILISMDYITGFISNAQAIVDERGAYCPATLPLIRDLFKINSITDLFYPNSFFILIVVAVSGTWIYFSNRIKKDRIKLICFSLLSYALIHPRFKDYSYMLLIGPIYFIISNISDRRIKLFGIILLILPVRIFFFSEVKNYFDIVSEYYPWLLLLTAYLGFIYFEIKGKWLKYELGVR